MPLSPGARLGPFEVVAPLGRGGMGEVYRAHDTRLGRDVAIKVLPEQAAGSPEALARFEREARAVAALNHPNILSLHDIGSEQGVSYAVTELLEGETMRELLGREGPIPPRKALDLAIQCARGLAAAHGRGIVHRDLKPENLFVTADGQLKILDFGIAVQDAGSAAAAAAETRVGTEPGMIVGTVAYMAPEQVRGEPASARSDIFSFGLVLYETLTGSNPFKRATTAETMAAILRDQPEAPVGIQGLPPVAARLVDRALEKRAEDRPESIRDLGFALEAALAAAREPAATAPGISLRRLGTRALAGACALLLAMTTAMWGYVRLSANRAASAAIAADLGRAETLVLRAQQERLDRLRLTARLVASFPQLKALFETDAPTIRDFLQTYQQRNPGTPQLVALGPDGYVLARTDVATGALSENGTRWLSALGPAGGAGFITLDSRPFHAAASVAEAGGTLFGYVLAAAPVDSTFAQLLRDATEDEAVLLASGGSVGSTLPAGPPPWESLDAWRMSGATPSRDVTIGTGRFSAREIVLAKEPRVSAVILKSHDAVTEPYRGIQTGLLLLGLTAALLVLAGGLAALRRVT
ncbi:MAG TPA: serine/threonine-protein kinase [Vicinamibacterales bacterium]|nr:serine/threonine-protein kinase [Vicinamibacterales bacterium]